MLTNWQPLPCVFEVSGKRIVQIFVLVLTDIFIDYYWTKTIRLFALDFFA